MPFEIFHCYFFWSLPGFSTSCLKHAKCTYTSNILRQQLQLFLNIQIPYYPISFGGLLHRAMQCVIKQNSFGRDSWHYHLASVGDYIWNTEKSILEVIRTATTKHKTALPCSTSLKLVILGSDTITAESG